ncbi:hypothetical protein [Burkholderia stagnalis]|uniref:hypothetical protein n=1 Tax=Burkholderia stagnalis TaxID=1503054 RepID=UPI000A770A15|nr:hypothetical protein [Burkholderia stagnalis]
MSELLRNETATAMILTHPAFDRPAVVNVRRPGRRDENVASLRDARNRRWDRIIRLAQEYTAVTHCARVWGLGVEQARERIAAQVASYQNNGRQTDFHEVALHLADMEGCYA